jgi:thiamine-phosphate pyrophosphorylase
MLRGKKIALYAITDDVLTPDETVLEQAKESLQAGADILQYRNKIKTDAEVKDICIALQNLCREYGVTFIIDDRPHLAQEIGADGLHIGKNDMPIAEARKIFPEGIIGVSCYASVRNAIEAEAEGATYVAFGSFFPSPTKPKSGIAPLSVIQRAKEAVKIPICVIGGINATNVHEIVKEKPDMISVVSGVYEGCITSNVKNLLKELEN